MATPPLSAKTLADTFNAWISNGRDKAKAAQALGIPYETYRSRMRNLRAKHPEWFEEAKEDEPRFREVKVEVEEKVVPERTVQDDLIVHRAKEEAKAAKTRLKDAVSQISDLQDKLEEYESVGNLSASPAEWTLTQQEAGSQEHMPLLFTSDFQIGETIDPEETEHGHAYNAEIFRRRYRRMIETTIYLSFEHGGRGWSYPGIIYARGGDSISGGIHEELAETDDLSPIEAVEMAFEEEAAGIAKLADAFGKVHVPDCGGGNHDRTTKKPRSKKAYANFDRLVNFMLRREFQNDPRITFQITRSMDVRFNIYEKRVLLTHGDRIGSRGGQGFIGPAATIMRGAQKVILEQSALGQHLDMVMFGHFHTPMYLGWIMVNGSLPGYSEFAKMNRMRPFPPQQMLSYWHEGRGCVDIKPLILTEA